MSATATLLAAAIVLILAARTQRADRLNLARARVSQRRRNLS